MKILFIDSPAFAKQDMLEAFDVCGIECTLFFHKAYNERSSQEFMLAFDNAVCNANFDFVFSFNYFPLISNCCNRHNIKYLSYVYDSPLLSLYSCTLINPCNYIFLFDKTTYHMFKNAGIPTVYYLPLAANVKRLHGKQAPPLLAQTLHTDISFVGSLYNEEHNLFERLTNLTDYTAGYLDAIMAAQKKIYGSFILESLLTPQILADMQKSVPYTPMSDGIENDAYVYANYFLARKITSEERISLLHKLSLQFPLKLYSHKPAPQIPNAQFMGTVDYYDMMPFVFQNSNVNLNITLKSIYSGIPLRCMDIMGTGAFLLTNYQSDFNDFFTPGEDYVYYDCEEDCVQKARYYLSHETERLQISRRALEKMQDAHTFIHRVKTMLSVLP